MKRVLAVIGVLFVLILVVLLHSTEGLASLGGRVEGARLERARRSPQFAGGKFRNKEPRGMAKTSNREMLRRQFFGDEQRGDVDGLVIRARGDRRAQGSDRPCVEQPLLTVDADRAAAVSRAADRSR